MWRVSLFYLHKSLSSHHFVFAVSCFNSPLFFWVVFPWSGTCNNKQDRQGMLIALACQFWTWLTPTSKSVNFYFTHVLFLRVVIIWRMTRIKNKKEQPPNKNDDLKIKLADQSFFFTLFRPYHTNQTINDTQQPYLGHILHSMYVWMHVLYSNHPAISKVKIRSTA